MIMRRAQVFELFSPSFCFRTASFELGTKTLALFWATAKKKSSISAENNSNRWRSANHRPGFFKAIDLWMAAIETNFSKPVNSRFGQILPAGR
jgi:hypothetical protein